jgi:large subunit ribosomal protein L30
MATKSNAKIKIRWIRSGIAFNRNQKKIVRSLGLRRLHQVVERQDNAVVRGLVAKISHLVEVLEETKPLVWTSVAEYTVVKPEPGTEASRDQNAEQPTVAEAAVENAATATPEPVAEAETGEPSSSEAEDQAPRTRQEKSAGT